MDAPTYPPTKTYSPPIAAPFEFSGSTVSANELLSVPAIKDMIFAEAPGFKLATQSPQLQTHLSNFSLFSLVDIGLLTQAQFDRLDARLRALPAGARPAL